MNYYIDFEATQFTNQIISIGCVAETGECFKTLVNPGEKELKQITSFITDLTGITKEDCAAAASADLAFESLGYFLNSCHDGKDPVFYCYGNSDKLFLKSTVANMKSFRSIILVKAIVASLIDYSSKVKQFFKVEQPFSLSKMFSFIKDEEVIQKHDALDDAFMLKEIAIKMPQICNPADADKIRQIPGQKKLDSKRRKPVPKLFYEIDGTMWECNTYKKQSGGYILCTTGDGKTKKFSGIDVAAMWLTKYVTGGSPRNTDMLNHKAKKIKQAIKSDKKYCGFKWEKK